MSFPHRFHFWCTWAPTCTTPDYFWKIVSVGARPSGHHSQGHKEWGSRNCPSVPLPSRTPDSKAPQLWHEQHILNNHINCSISNHSVFSSNYCAQKVHSWWLSSSSLARRTERSPTWLVIAGQFYHSWHLIWKTGPGLVEDDQVYQTPDNCSTYLRLER